MFDISAGSVIYSKAIYFYPKEKVVEIIYFQS